MGSTFGSSMDRIGACAADEISGWGKTVEPGQAGDWERSTTRSHRRWRGRAGRGRGQHDPCQDRPSPRMAY
jgi:hypothetical protein